MRFILTAKHWQVFIVLMFSAGLMQVRLEDDMLMTQIFWSAGFFIYFLWPALVVHALQEYFPKRARLNYTFFAINSFIYLFGYILTALVFGSVRFTGIAALPAFYFFYAMLHYHAFPAKAIKSIQLERPVAFGEYLSTFLMILFLPIGIWFIQPQLNKIAGEDPHSDSTILDEESIMNT